LSSRRRTLIGWSAAASVAAVGLVLSGCTSPGGTGDDPSTSGTVVLAVNGLPSTLTEVNWEGDSSQLLLDGLNSRLAAYGDVACDSTASGTDIVGGLAESIEFNDDRTAVVIKLKPLVSAEGNTLSAEDVKWSLERAMELQPVAKGNLEMSGYDTSDLVTIVDPTTVELNVATVTSFTIETLSGYLFNIHDSKAVLEHATADDPWGEQWLSTNIADYSGWKLESYQPGSAITLVAVPDWGGERGAGVDRIVVNAVPDAATRQQLLSAGSAQLATGLEYTAYESLSKTDGINVQSCQSGVIQDYLILETTTAPLDDPKVREAISFAVDRSAIASAAYAGYADPARSMVASGFGGPAAASYTRDVAKAKDLLAQAGYPDGLTLSLSYSPSSPGPVAERAAVLLQSQLAEAGITLELNKVVNVSEFMSQYYDHDFQLFLRHNLPPNTDAGFNLPILLSTGGHENVGQWSNAEFDRLGALLPTVLLDQEDERSQIIGQMADLLATDNPNLGLVEPYNVYAASDSIVPIVPRFSGSFAWTEIGTK